MVSMNEEVLNIVKKEGEHRVQIGGLIELLNKCFPCPLEVHDADLLELVESVVSFEAGSMVVARQFVTEVVERLVQASLPIEQALSVMQKLLTIISSRSISYEEQIFLLRGRLASILEAAGNYSEAAQVLAGINLETGQVAFTVAKKMDIYLQIADLLLQAQQITDAEQFVNRASLQQQDVPPAQLVKYKASYARVLDARRKFIEASQRYYELSQIQELTREEKDVALIRALTCTVLANPGIARTKMLTILYKDERVRNLSGINLLQKLYFDRLIRPEELVEFEKNLLPHQLNDEEGHSILQKVILEHNVNAVSHLYQNISMESLSKLLNITLEQAEEVTVQMISSDRLHGTIDQIQGYVNFHNVHALPRWDEEITLLCQQVNRVSDLVLAAHPHLAAA